MASTLSNASCSTVPTSTTVVDDEPARSLNARTILLVGTGLLMAMFGAYVASTIASAARAESQTIVGGTTIQRPHIVIEGSSESISAVIMIEGLETQTINSGELPLLVALDGVVAGDKIDVVVTNHDDSGTTECVIGAGEANWTTSHPATTSCVIS